MDGGTTEGEAPASMSPQYPSRAMARKKATCRAVRPGSTRASEAPCSPGMEIVLIAAVARNGVIGADGALPWRLPDDLRRFRRLTLSKPVVMGRKTFASIGRALPQRRNVVLSRSPCRFEGVEVVGSVEAACALLSGAPEVCVIGGGDIYRAFLPLAARLELTHVEADVAGDARFPDLDPTAWRCVDEDHHPADDTHPFAMRFATYVRRGADATPRRVEHASGTEEETQRS